MLVIDMCLSPQWLATWRTECTWGNVEFSEGTERQGEKERKSEKVGKEGKIRKVNQRNVRPTVTLVIKPLSPVPGKGSMGKQTCR